MVVEATVLLATETAFLVVETAVAVGKDDSFSRA
jgi:hypothetical protein